MLLLLTNALLVAAASAFLLAPMKVRGLLPYLLSLFVVAFSDVVLVLEVAGLANALRPSVVLALQVCLTGLSAVVWLALGKARLLYPMLHTRPVRPSLDSQSAIKLALLGILALGVVYIYLQHALLVLAVAPNNYDALTYHLSRVGYWLQYHSFYPWPTPDPRQTTMAMNAELGLLWTILWWGTDRLSGFVQWAMVPVIALGIYGLTRLLHHSRWQAAMTALLWTTLTQVVMQSSTAQNDLVTTAFWVTAVYFFFLGMRQRAWPPVLLSGLALGLAMGAKGTTLLALPGLGLGLLLIWVVERGSPALRLHLFRWAAACVLGIAVFGSYAYVQNIVAFGNPLGASTPRTGPQAVTKVGRLGTITRRVRDNLGRYAYQFVDFSGLPFRLAAEINPVKSAAFSTLYGWLRVNVENKGTIGIGRFDLGYINPVNENSSWFGPLGILLIPAAFVQACRGIRQRNAVLLFLVVFGALFPLVLAALENWTAYKGRYFMIPVAVSFPLVATFLDTRKPWRAVVSACIVLVGLVPMLTITRNNSVLQQITWQDALAAEPRYLNSWFNVFDYRMIVSNVPTDASIGLTGGLDFTDYPFFGEHFTHRVTLAVPADPSLSPKGGTARYEADFQGSDYLYLTGSNAPSNLQEVLQGFDPLSLNGASSLWIRKDLRTATECDGGKWPFSDFLQVSSDGSLCPRFPIGASLWTFTNTGDNFFPIGQFVPEVGAGRGEALTLDLLVKKASTAAITIQLVPKDITGDQVLDFKITGDSISPIVQPTPINKNGLLEFNTPLQPGLYTIELKLDSGLAQIRVRSITITSQ